ncbi:glycoside hydrolase family 13 protein [Caldanaerobius polysaccharolyticus]|uniref:glycoside hydrolase family 13 protein n=1 Tax=Caldanaerobius polysaccharolyticus TaxID=44256 RepID=UPI00047E6ADA|nr:glycoside hydrolase family 13 protein [Caldanaerobius polysaccharolyticus]
MIKEAVFHKSDSTYAYPIDEKSLVIKLRTGREDIDKVILCYGDRYDPDNPVNMYEKEMTVAYRDSLFDYYETIITPPFNRICYFFKLISGDEVKIFCRDRFSERPPADRNRYYMFPYICRGDIYHKYDWWEDSIFYQIFVDRFYKENIDSQWFRKPKSDDIFGGNLKGIIQKLDYLCELGINRIYLTPIFKSDSNHKYDTIDYYKIDENFGDEAIFKKLIDECHKRGIKVILDAVFNHTSDKFFAFKDAMENGDNSRYRDWYFIKNRDEYETFGYVKNMPKLNTANEQVSEYLLGIARYWIENFDIDGWRLDVANEIDHNFWRRFRNEVKRAKKDAFIIGEVWDGGESYLKGDQFDSVMNYPFMFILVDYFAKNAIDTYEFDYLINNLFVRYKKYIRTILLNLIDSHDTCRFLYECGGDIEKMKMAVFFQMTCIGIPMIFYGDEAGLTGANDPDCRRTIDFDRINKDLFEFYKKLIKIRKENRALRAGEYRTVLVHHDVYAYSRYLDDEEIINVFNKGERAKKISLKINGGKVLDLYNNEEYAVSNGVLDIEIQPGGKYILKVM